MEKLITTHNIALQDIINQLIKDLTLSGIDADIFQNIKTASQLAATLKKIVSEMLTYKFEEFNRFMYRIDVPESKLANVFSRDLNLLVDELCVLILKREMQKIIFRQQFGIKK